MAYKTILTILDTPENADIAGKFAFALAAEHGAHLIGLHAEVISAVPLVAPMEIPDPIAVQALQDMARQEAATIEQKFRSTAGSSDISYEWRSFASSIGYASEPLIEVARSADLVLAVQPDPAAPSDAHLDVESFLLESGRPMLLIPYVYRQPMPIRRVLVAWNGSKEVARATFDALPFLKAAEAVEVFSVRPAEDEGKTVVTGADIAVTLARHDVNVTLTTVYGTDSSASKFIENRLSDNSIDLLVMGAHTHSWLWQALFGGTTKTLLQSMTALTLLAR